MTRPFSTQYKTFVDMLETQNYVVLDTETTGLRDGEIVDICIAKANGEIIINERVKPCWPIPVDATRIHGIADHHVQNCRTWPEILPQIVPALTGTNVVAYNATYDRGMMHKTNERWQLPKVDWKIISPWFCAMECFAEFFGDWNSYRSSYTWQKLSTAAQYFKIQQTAAHTALDDVMTVVRMCQLWPHYND